MYTDENYFWGLVAYGLGVLLVLPMMVKVTGWVMPWRPLRSVLRLFFVTLLVTPVVAFQGMSYIAPAWMVAAFEFVQPSSPEGPARALTPLVFVFAALLVLRMAVYFGWRMLPSRAATEGATSYREFAEIAPRESADPADPEFRESGDGDRDASPQRAL